jgi:putative aldouronate transport system permease protein
MTSELENNSKSLTKSKGFNRWKAIKKNYDLYIIIAPVILYFIIFLYWPMYGVQIAFKDFSPALGITGSPWAGLKHFERFFNSYYIERLLTNTIGISGYSILVGIPAPIILALMFNELRSSKFRTVSQTIFYAPNFLSIVVVVSMILFFMNPTTGFINAVRELMGYEVVNFMAEPKYFWHIYVWSGVWQGVGWGSIVYSAAISGIPTEQYEAAVIDGATKMQRIWHVTIPGILPTIVIISIMNVGNIMNVGFEKIFLMQNNLNVDASEVIATYVYKSGIQGAQFSFSAAVGLFNNVVNFILLAVVNFVARRVGETSLW